MAEREDITRLLDELAPHCTPPVLRGLERDKFNPEHVDDSIAKPLAAPPPSAPSAA